MKRPIVAVDLDDTLCVGQPWRDEKDVLEAAPIKVAIERVNKLYRNHFIVIYTARQNYLISNTLEWLQIHNVKFHAISNHKVNFDYIIDDKREP